MGEEPKHEHDTDIKQVARHDTANTIIKRATTGWHENKHVYDPFNTKNPFTTHLTRKTFLTHLTRIMDKKSLKIVTYSHSHIIKIQLT